MTEQGLRTGEGRGQWRKKYNEELHSLHFHTLLLRLLNKKDNT